MVSTRNRMTHMVAAGARATVLALGLLAICGPVSGAGGEAAVPERARGLARRTLDAMGGAEAFARLRTLRFDFVVERDGREVVRRSHVWDRHDGRYRVAGIDREGREFVVLLDVSEPTAGMAWLDGRELQGEDLAGQLERAYGMFINDTYWLLMPAKLLDPGVHLAYEGEQADGDRLFDVVRVTFDHVGLTPGDTYWAWLSRDGGPGEGGSGDRAQGEIGLMKRWDFVLEGQKPEERSTFIWDDWRPIAGVRLSAVKTAPGGGTAIRFENLAGSEDRDDGAFLPPSQR